MIEILDDLRSLGVRWLRLDVAWSDVQASGSSSYDWDRYDAVIEAGVSRGLQVDGGIVYTPGWAGSGDAEDDHYAPADPADYARFAGEVARRYGPRGVHVWEIWNEPNIDDFWKPAPDVRRYATLLERANAAIKSADRSAVVLTGGTAPAETGDAAVHPVEFLDGLYSAGGPASFDAVAHHPYCFPAMPSDDEQWSAWTQMDRTSPSLRSVMTAHGDGNKRIWATEYGAPTHSDGVTREGQAAMITEAFQIFRSSPWAGPLFVYTYEDWAGDAEDEDEWFGLVDSAGSPKPGWSAFRRAAAAFASESVTEPPADPPRRLFGRRR